MAEHMSVLGINLYMLTCMWHITLYYVHTKVSTMIIQSIPYETIYVYLNQLPTALHTYREVHHTPKSVPILYQ